MGNLTPSRGSSSCVKRRDFARRLSAAALAMLQTSLEVTIQSLQKWR